VVSSAPAAAAPPPYAVRPSTRPAQGVRDAEDFIIPTGYGDHHIVAMVKDPWWIYAYWEIQSHIEREVRRRLAPEEVVGLQPVLRVYDVTDLPLAPGGSPGDFPDQPAHRTFDVALAGMAMSWYVRTDAPGRAFILDIGLLTRQGRFIALARSNRVATPRFGPSDVIDEQWMSAEEVYWRLYGMTAGIGGGASAPGLRAGLERLMHSPGYWSGVFSPTKIAERGFWLMVDAELIVYGATEPNAAVTIQGRPIRLRSDGTFSIRMALPDGTQTIPVEATSADGVETRAITPIVTRKTESRTSGPSSPRSADGRRG
jgi:hypothetical protein